MTHATSLLVSAMTAEIALLRKCRLPKGLGAEAKRRRQRTERAWEMFRDETVQMHLKVKL